MRLYAIGPEKASKTPKSILKRAICQNFCEKAVPMEVADQAKLAELKRILRLKWSARLPEKRIKTA